MPLVKERNFDKQTEPLKSRYWTQLLLHKQYNMLIFDKNKTYA